MDSEKIREIISEIQSSIRHDKEEYFSNKYSEFKEKYPMMLAIACTTKLDMNNLDFMFKLLGQIHNKEKSQFDASAQVGQMLFDRYVDPKINTNIKNVAKTPEDIVYPVDP
jgi:hypothetical protein